MCSWFLFPGIGQVNRFLASAFCLFVFFKSWILSCHALLRCPDLLLVLIPLAPWCALRRIPSPSWNTLRRNGFSKCLVGFSSEAVWSWGFDEHFVTASVLLSIARLLRFCFFMIQSWSKMIANCGPGWPSRMG